MWGLWDSATDPENDVIGVAAVTIDGDKKTQTRVRTPNRSRGRVQSTITFTRAFLLSTLKTNGVDMSDELKRGLEG
ncbi:MAG: hypothetical protein ACI9YT_002921, partial [Halobacteriales archaeon]